jgi:hypothetical protein
MFSNSIHTARSLLFKEERSRLFLCVTINGEKCLLMFGGGKLIFSNMGSRGKVYGAGKRERSPR